MTTSREVVLDLSAGVDTSAVLISNTEDFKDAQKESFIVRKQWTLSGGMGSKTVYVRFLHADGSASPTISDTILFLELASVSEAPAPMVDEAPERASIRTVEPVVAPPQKILGIKVTRESSALAARLAGRILLQVQEHGEAWYVYPNTKARYYLGRPADAFSIMRTLGLGITNRDLQKIPIGIIRASDSPAQDSDGDGLSDNLEGALGTNPSRGDTDADTFSDGEEVKSNYDPLRSGNARLPIDAPFTKKLFGKIVLQVEAHGEAWYVNPSDGRRYFLGRSADAFAIMRNLGLGITNENLEKIDVGATLDSE